MFSPNYFWNFSGRGDFGCLHLALDVLLVVVEAVRVGTLAGGLSLLQQVGVTTVGVAGVHLEAGLFVVVAGEDFLERDDTGNCERDLADDQSLASDESQSLESQRSSDSHGGEHGSDDVFVVLLASLAASLGQINLDGVSSQELLDVLNQSFVDLAETVQGAGVCENWSFVGDCVV